MSEGIETGAFRPAEGNLQNAHAVFGCTGIPGHPDAVACSA